MRGHSGQTYLFSDLDGETSEAGQDDAVALLDARGNDLAVTSGGAGTDGENGSLGRRLRRSLRREEESRSGFLPDRVRIGPTRRVELGNRARDEDADESD